MQEIRPRAALATLLMIVCSCACSSPTAPGGSSSHATPTVTAVAVSDLPDTVNYGETVQIKAIATFSDGERRDVAEVTWTSSNGDVASISTAGVLRATGVGSAEISATFNGVQGKGHIVVPVPPPPVAQLAIKVDDHGSIYALAAITRVTFDLSQSTGAGLKYEVAFGDGESESSALSTHKYLQPTAYNAPFVVRGTVTDVVGRVHSVQKELGVAALFDNYFTDYWASPPYPGQRLSFGFPRRVFYNSDTNEQRTVTSYFVTATNDMQVVLDDGTTADGPIHLDFSCCQNTRMTLTFHGGTLNGRTFDFVYDPRY